MWAASSAGQSISFTPRGSAVRTRRRLPSGSMACERAPLRRCFICQRLTRVGPSAFGATPTFGIEPQGRDRPVADIRSGRHPERMSDFSEIDDVIAMWVRTANTTLHTEWAGAPARFFPIPGDPPFECFQISVQAPEDERTSVTARAIDTNDDIEEQMEYTWRGPIVDLDEMLRAAVALVGSWKIRDRSRPDPASPW